MKFIKASNQREIFSVIYIRKDVFMDEQKVSVDEELDHRDIDADHYLLEVNDEFVGTCRVYYDDNDAIIGRVAVLKEHRNKGYAKYLMSKTIETLKDKDINKVVLGAQVQALNFYEKLGFKVCGKLYIDANIEHYPMELIL